MSVSLGLFWVLCVVSGAIKKKKKNYIVLMDCVVDMSACFFLLDKPKINSFNKYIFLNMECLYVIF